MKKFLFITIVILLAATGVCAAPGDVVGEIYSTDILAYVNGKPINSYNIGGQTVVLAEDLCNNDTGEHYGFNCIYDNDTRTLTIDSDFTSGNADAEVVRGTVGEVVGQVYETDIKVIFNSYEVDGYNIGGQTAICIEALGAYDQSEHNAEFGYSKYLCNAVWNGETREISLNSFIQDKNYFGNYPGRKLKFELTDNQLSCYFDQLNPYINSLTVNLSEQFKNDCYKISTVYMNDERVGQMFVIPSGMVILNMNDRAMHLQTNSLETVLSYDEAVNYAHNNFEIVTEKQDDNATIYLAKKDGVHYLLFAMTNGGLVCDSKYDSSYSLVELVTNADGVHCLNLKTDTFSGSIPVSTLGYDFSDGYEKYVTGAVSEMSRRSSRAGSAVVTIDGKSYVVDAINPYEYNYNLLVDIDAVCELLDIDYMMYGGVFYLAPGYEKHAIDAKFDMESGKLPDKVGVMSSSTVYVNGTVKSFKYTGQASLVNNAHATEKNALPYYYDGKVYVPFKFFEDMYK